jgi:hypothetical protein
MSKPKLELQKLTIAELIQRSREILSKMTGNATYPTPNPPLLDISAVTTAVEGLLNEAQNAKLEWIDKVNQLNSEVADLQQKLTLLANYVFNTSSGNAEKIMSAGMEIASKPGTAPVPAQVIIQTISEVGAGKLELKWKKVPYTKTYAVQMTTNPDDPSKWTNLQSVTKTKYIAGGLTSGTKYWFRVRAVGSAGEGEWSDMFVKYAA